MFDRKKEAHDFVRCFNTPAGRNVLSYLRGMTVEKTLGPEIPAPTLYYREGQKALVKHIEAMIEKGQK